MLVRTGRGKYQITKNDSREFACSLYNFDIDGADVKEDHKQILRSKVFPFLQEGGSAAIVGLASVTGPEQHDQELSLERAESVVKALNWVWAFSGSGFLYSGPMRIRKVVGRGKQWAQRFSRKENEFWRAVWVHVWDQAVPPSDSQVNFGMQLPPLADSNLLMDIGQGLDVASWIISMIAAAEIIPVVDMAASILDTLFSLVAAWAASDQNAYLNGYIQGYDMAMKDMSDTYADSSLHTKPLSQWPPPARPKSHQELWASQPNISQQKWHEGEDAGCEAAYQQVLKWDRQPLAVEVAGQTKRLTGREVLRTLALQHPDRVGEYFVKQFNEALRKKGKRPWPTLL